MSKTTIATDEVAKFAQYSAEWWNTEGPLKTLHDINPARIAFVEQFTSLKNQRILDVGCGGGILSELMAKRGGLVTGLDVEPDAIKTAIQHAQKNHDELQYICQPIENFDTEFFNVITCMEMLEHVPEPQLIIEHAVRLLVADGLLFLSTINRTFKAYSTAIIAAEYVFNILPRQTHDFNKFIKPSELAAMVRRCGLEVIGVAGINYNPFTRKASLQDTVEVNYLMACRKIA